MNEYMNSRVEADKPSKTKRKKKKKHKVEEFISHEGHQFQLNIINIPTACEVCSSFFLWPIERSLVCRSKHRIEEKTKHDKSCSTLVLIMRSFRL